MTNRLKYAGVLQVMAIIWVVGCFLLDYYLPAMFVYIAVGIDLRYVGEYPLCPRWVVVIGWPVLWIMNAAYDVYDFLTAKKSDQ